MRSHLSTLGLALAGGLLTTACRDAQLEPPTAPGAPVGAALSQVAPMYAADFVATAATGYDLNDAGDVVGRSYPDPGCGPFCLPTPAIAVWQSGVRRLLPLVPGTSPSYHFPSYINNQGLVAGVTGIPGSATRIAVWRPGTGGYTVTDLGVFPGTSSAEVGGLDEQGRLVGWATMGGAIPTLTVPFLWSQATGLVDLRAQGYPNQKPAAMSPGGMVVTWGARYQLGNPASVVALPPPPSGFLGAGVNGSAINDAGDQAHFLVSTSSQNLVYPFRLTAAGQWQMISGVGTGHMTRYGMGSINPGQDVTLTITSIGAVAEGPTGVATTLASRVSPAYGGAAVTTAGPMNAGGVILAQMMVGRSPRLVKLVPTTGCGANCLVASALTMTGTFVQDPAYPGSCFQGGKMYNVSTARVTVTDEAGLPLGGAVVSGRFLDDYWTDRPVTGTTNAAGVVSWSHQGPCGVGAVAFLIDRITLGTRILDRTRGTLAASVIPGTTPPPPPPVNQAPVPVPVVTCQPGRLCRFNGTGSYDPDGTIVAYRWTTEGGTLLSTKASFTKTYPRSGGRSVVLRVTDNGGLSASKTVMFTVLP